jgi:hypothetical protein
MLLLVGALRATPLQSTGNGLWMSEVQPRLLDIAPSTPVIMMTRRDDPPMRSVTLAQGAEGVSLIGSDYGLSRRCETSAVEINAANATLRTMGNDFACSWKLLHLRKEIVQSPAPP